MYFIERLLSLIIIIELEVTKVAVIAFKKDQIQA